MSYFQRHIFFCLNERANGESSCAQHNPQAAFDHCKSRVKALNLAGPGGVRVNKSGCLDRCAGGPVAVVYPDAVWYTFVDKSDIDEIVERHLAGGEVVERLQLPPERRPMNAQTQRLLIDGPAGKLQLAIDEPEGAANAKNANKGLALVLHPLPTHGGTMDNKVVQTLARACVQLGYRTVRFNFRSVGASEGSFDGGPGELDDALAVLKSQRRDGEPFVLAGFSFGAYVATKLAEQVAPDRLALVGLAASRFPATTVPADTLVVHGEADEVVPLAAVLDWARPQALPVTVMPGTGHFFHGQLPLLKRLLLQAWSYES